MSSVTVASESPRHPAATVEQAPPHVPAQAPPLFSPDTIADDGSTRAGIASFLSGLVCHPQAGTPFLVALFGSAGSGKSVLLGQILRLVAAPEPLRGAERTPHDLANIVAVRVDASSGTEPSSALVSRVVSALGSAYPALAEEAVYAGGDPVKAARAAGERVNDLRRKLDTERQVLDEVGGRQARLVEAVLFESPGSRVDAYARANRTRIEARLRAFGVPVSDPIASYKHLVRESAENGGSASRVGLVLRALWGFKGQGTLVALAIALLIIGWGSGSLASNQDSWAAWLTSFGDRSTSLTAWAQDHAGWLASVSHSAYGLALLAILIDIIRAIRFLQPVLKGASLLTSDLDGRRRDLDSLLAHQTRRVDHLTAEAESAVRNAQTAERRVEARKASGLLEPTPPADDDVDATASLQESAEAFFVGLSASIDQQTASGPAPGPIEASGASPAPRRIVVAIDELDRLPPAKAAAYLEVAHRLLARPNFVALAAVERSHILTGFSEADPALAGTRLDRCVQLSYDLDADAAMPDTLGAEDASNGQAPQPAVRSGIDLPWQDFESPLVEGLMAFAGPNPRSAKRFLNSYRVARADPRLVNATPAELAALACALALDRSGAAAELGNYRDTTGAGEPAAGAPTAHIARALAAAQQAIGSTFTPADARRGLQVARIYSRRG